MLRTFPAFAGLLIAIFVIPGSATAQETEPDALRQVLQKEWLTVNISLVSIQTRIQSRLTQYLFPGIPKGATFDAYMAQKPTDPMLTLVLAIDDRGETAATTVPCKRLLSMMTYLLAEGISPVLSEQMSKGDISLDHVAEPLRGAACSALLANIEQHLSPDALPGFQAGELADLEKSPLKDFCATNTRLIGVVVRHGKHEECTSNLGLESDE
jgi:hypothetical protein